LTFPPNALAERQQLELLGAVGNHYLQLLDQDAQPVIGVIASQADPLQARQ
jgi:hypothetical protein